jgi:hypothetical protein
MKKNQKKTIRIIDGFQEAESGWCAVIALPKVAKVTHEKGWWIFKKKIETLLDHVYLPVAFWANAHLVTEDEEGNGMRSSSAVVAMVRAGDSIEAAPHLDGYIGLVSPDEDSIHDVNGMAEAVKAWRINNETETHVANEKARSLMN